MAGHQARDAAVPLDEQALLRLRLANQHLGTPQLSDPAALVGHLVAVQSQDFTWATWGLGQRVRDASAASIERAFNSGAILRTHVLRPTWHFVTPADIRWMLELTAPRIKASMASYQRGIDPALYPRVNVELTWLLEGGKAMTRAELGTALQQAGMTSATRDRLGALLMTAELDGIICSGPRRGRQSTYALLGERAPAVRRLEREEALAELTLRYFVSHGPATVRDCSWWSGLTIGDVRGGLEQVRTQLQTATVGGVTYWFAPATPPPMPDRVYLLPNYDEYTVAFRDRAIYYDPARGQPLSTRPAAPFDHAIVVGGRVEGVWRPTSSHATGLAIQARWFDPPSDDRQRSLQRAVERVGAFFSVPASIREQDAD